MESLAPTTAAPLDVHRSNHARFESERGAAAPAFLRGIRSRGMERFAETGFPTTRDEDWKYTSVAPIAKVAFRLAPPRPPALSPTLIESFRLPRGTAYEIVFVNGAFSPELSQVPALPKGVHVGRLADAAAKDRAAVEPLLARLASPESAPFVALNTAFLEDGAFVRVDRGTVVDKPIHVLHLATSPGEPVVAHPRLLAAFGERAEATLVETFAGIPGGVTFTNAVSEIAAGPAAVVKHVKIELELETSFHVATTHVRLERATNFSSQSISIGGAIVRNDANAVFGGEGAEATLDGLYLARGRQLVDNHTAIDHALPNCASREVYKGVLDGRARGVFNGKVFVRADAQKTDGKQTNKNLLLSEHASIDTKPQLEIFANDVKCTHGATIGQIDENALFYLRSRGIGRETARSLLIYAFATEITHKVPVEALRVRLEDLVQRWLPEGAAAFADTP